MKPRFLHKDPGTSAPEASRPPPDPGWLTSWSREDRACCCPARPVVRAIIPPAPQRPRPVGLLLCGHHYPGLPSGLLPPSARMQVLPGRADAAAAALVEDAGRPRAGPT
jgi:hypothetical protein